MTSIIGGKQAKFLFSLFILMGLLSADSIAQKYQLNSPDDQVNIRINISNHITYKAYYKGNEIVASSNISLNLKGHQLGIMPQVTKSPQSRVNKTIDCFNCRFSKLTDHYNELKIAFKGNYAIIFRAYDEGLAYRFVTDIEDSITVVNETAQFNLVGKPGVILPLADNLTSWELPYTTYTSSGSIPKRNRSVLPALFYYKESGIKVVLAESDLRDYPGMYIQADGSNVHGYWAGYPSKTVMGSWGNFVSVVKERAPFIANTIGKRSFPWRVIIISDDDKKLLANDLVYKLATPSQVENTSWIKPGKAAWEWWSDAMLPGVDIPSGMDNRNTALYKYYVDFAARYHLEYVLIDAGWSDNYNLTRVNPKIDIREVISYARKKDVGVFLWCVASTLLDSLQFNMNYLKELGAAGIKVDFFDRNDQQAIGWYEEIAETASNNKLMIDFHGCSVPAGLQRTYPNVLNFEAVRGNECNKWDSTSNPDYHLLIPFIRMLAGPMDYTPGSMRNKTRAVFTPVPHGMPWSQGTRCHELAMYVLFDQPLAMLCGSPAIYEQYPDIMKFLSAVPAVFDDTKVLEAKLGDYALVAKRKEENWYLGGMTNWEPRNMILDFSFLPPGVIYEADLYTDLPESNKDAEKYKHEVIPVNNKTKLNLNLASGGGVAAYLHFKK